MTIFEELLQSLLESLELTPCSLDSHQDYMAGFEFFVVTF